MRQVEYQACYSRYQVSFYLCRIGSVLKHQQFPKYIDQDCQGIFFLYYTLPMMIQISGKKAHLAQKIYFYQLAAISKVES